MEVKYKNEAFLVVGEYVCPCDVPTGIFTLYLRFVKLCRENKSDTVVCLMTNQRSLYRGTQGQFLENICSKDDLRSRIFGTIAVKIYCVPDSPRIFEHPKMV